MTKSLNRFQILFQSGSFLITNLLQPFPLYFSIYTKYLTECSNMKFTHTLAAIAIAAATTQAAVSYTPVTEGATGGAQKLYNFLATNYGVKTISGMMTGDVGSATDIKSQVDVDTMYQKTGKYPVLVGFDFLFATGLNSSSSWYQSYTNTALTLAKDLWNKGGIPAFTWHWKDPSDSVDQFYVNGHDTVTTFDFTKGFNSGTTTWNTSSTVYQELVSDIDEIAAYFLQLQKDSVAAVFRPLHEASGAWFWWGTQGGAAYQALYNLVYDRMVNVDGVKNLVWVWNPEYATDTDWNPGSTKYDVISLDIYEAYNYTNKFVTGYNTLTTNFGAENKIFAVSENGPIPDISTMTLNKTVWSWWMPWYQSWSGKFLDQTMDAVWKANMSDPCTITLDEMPGWNNYTISTSQVEACTVAYALGDLDTARTVADVYPGDTATNGWLRVKFSTPEDDTAKGNVIIASSSVGNLADLSSATTLTMTVYNTNELSGIWFTVAFLGNASTGWGWAQPDGCWVNAGDSTTCTIDLTTTTKDKVVLTGTDYTTFMSNLSKVYIEIFGENYTGTIFYDNVVVDGSTTINAFDDTTETIEAESDKNLVVAEIIGKGKTTAIATHTAMVSASKLSVQGSSIQLTLTKSGTISVDLFDLQGHRVANLHNGSLSAGVHAIAMQNVNKGVYVIRAKGAGLNALQKVIVK